MSVTCTSRAGSIPPEQDRLHVRRMHGQRLNLSVGRHAFTPAWARTSSVALLHSSGEGVSPAGNVLEATTRACAPSDRSLSRSSFSSPFITDRITMSAITPSMTPASAAQVMKDTKNLWVRART